MTPPLTPIDTTDIAKARDLLLQGDVVGMPTETVYGLAASIDSLAGLKKIFALKERPFFDPLIVHVASFEQVAQVVSEFPPLADFVARWFWPGPLTLVVPKSDRIDPIITSGLQTVAVRYPAHPVAQELIRVVGSPLAAPSANKFGRTSPSTSAHVLSEFGPQLFILEGGACEIGLESTVITFAKNAAGADEIRILRPGGVTKEQLEEALDRWGNPVRVVVAESSESPGHLKHHYMPTVPLIITSEAPTEDDIESLTSDLGLKRFPTEIRELELPEDAAQAARILYSEMRALCETGADLLYVRETSERRGGLWTAVWDRLTRAASWTKNSGSRLDAAE